MNINYLNLKQFIIVVLAALVSLSGPVLAEQIVAKETPDVTLQTADLNASDDPAPTVALSAPKGVTANVLLNGKKRTLSQCTTELEVRKEIYNVAWLRGTTNDLETWDSLSPEAQNLIGDNLGEITMWAAEDDFRTNHMICHQQHPDSFPEWNRSLLTAAIEMQKEVKPEAIKRHRIPVTLNYKPPPKSYAPEVVLRGDVEQKNLASEAGDAGTD